MLELERYPNVRRTVNGRRGAKMVFLDDSRMIFADMHLHATSTPTITPTRYHHHHHHRKYRSQNNNDCTILHMIAWSLVFFLSFLTINNSSIIASMEDREMHSMHFTFTLYFVISCISYKMCRAFLYDSFLFAYLLQMQICMERLMVPNSAAMTGVSRVIYKIPPKRILMTPWIRTGKPLIW